MSPCTVEVLEGRRLLVASPSSVPGELLVAFEAGVGADEIRRLYADYGLSEVRTLGRHLFGSPNHLKLVLAPPDEVGRLIPALERDRRVRYAGPNRVLSRATAAVPDDPGFSTNWGLRNTGQTGGTPDADIDADEAWDVTTGGGEVVVAVIDTGVDYTHPDLADNVWRNPGEIPGNEVDDDANGFVDDYFGYDSINGDGDPMDDNGHGTHVAGTIAAVGNNGVGVAGVNWAVKVMAVKMIHADDFATVESLVAAYDYVVAARRAGVNVRVTNESFGSWGEEAADIIEANRDASEALGAAGILEVAAAHNLTLDNDASDLRSYPASFDFPHIISVAATDHDDRFALFSNWGATSVDLAAPGEQVYSTTPGGGYDWGSGTSMAAPHVAGAAALVWSAHPDLTAAEVKARILNGVDPIGHVGSNVSRPTVTNGRLNVRNALLVPPPDAGDVTPPAAVRDLAVASTSPWSATLTWTAPGDDGAAGRAGFYDVRYSTAPITAANWDDAEEARSEPAPRVAGAAEAFTVDGLEPGTLYYFAVRTKDNAHNESAPSAAPAGLTGAAKYLVDETAERGSRDWAATGLWHRSRLRGYDSSSAWYYGVDRTRTYDTGEGTTGALTLATPIDLRGVGAALLRFNEFRQPGMAPFAESARVEVSTDGQSWEAPFDARYPMFGWARREVDLSPYAGGDLFLRFVFDSNDAGFPAEELFNEFEGWYVDNVRVLAPAPRAAGFSVNDVLVTEGNDGTSRATFTVTRPDGAGHASVRYETEDGRAEEGGTRGGRGDYREASGVLSFAPGETVKTVTVRVNGDRLGEENESFTLRLCRPRGAWVADGEGRATIVDDEPRLILYTPWVAWEGLADPAWTFPVDGLLSRPSDVPVSFRYSTRDGTARGGRDYERASGLLTFAPGETWKSFPIRLIADTRVEPFEHFFIDVSPATGNAVASRGGVFYILDDDLPPGEVLT